MFLLLEVCFVRLGSRVLQRFEGSSCVVPCGVPIHINGPKQQQWSSSSNDWWGPNTDPTTVPAAKTVIPANFKSDDKFFDSTAVGSGNHQFHRVVQSTDWSRKAQIAGRPEDDLQAYELCFRIE